MPKSPDQIRRYAESKRLRNLQDFGVSTQGAQMIRYIPVEYVSSSEYFRGIIYLGDSKQERFSIFSRCARAHITEIQLSPYWHFCAWTPDLHAPWSDLESIAVSWLAEASTTASEAFAHLWHRGDTKPGVQLALRLRALYQRHQALIARRRQRKATP